MKFGIYRLHEVLDEAAIKSIEQAYRMPVQVLSLYRAWNRCEIEADRRWLERLRCAPRDIMLSWEPWRIDAGRTGPPDQPAFSLKNIISGRYDVYLRAFADELARIPRLVYLRPMHEMNGNWYPWCVSVNGNTCQDYISAWCHIHDLVAGRVSAKVKWVWTPYARSYPGQTVEQLADVFPGDDRVDWVGIDGYNWGTSRPWSEWQSFEQVFSDAYRQLSAISRRPVMIAETACAEAGGSKSTWITEAFGVLTRRFQRVEMLIWFDVNKECDWAIASSRASLAALRASGRIRLPSGT